MTINLPKLIGHRGVRDLAPENTLQSIKKHKKTNMLSSMGKSDITYQINFKLMERISKKLKLKSQGITSQRNFLINMGILHRAEIISKNLPFSKKADIYFRLKRLIDKNQMGDLFKVMLIINEKITDKQIQELIISIKKWPGLNGKDLASKVTCTKPYKWENKSYYNKIYFQIK